MGKFIKGDVVVIPFPFSDLSTSKRRPALVLAGLTGNDIILCQVTSKAVSDEYAVPLLTHDFNEGSLNQDSNIRPNRLFTADESIIVYKAGAINNNKLGMAIDKIIEILAKA
ncbi:MAG: type II toxin-antitoxin system PemK/MazF family toxin [Dethiobacter sp.]|jgi:mRNA interferase MazF|nr:type II toxin-antitoxin system PemK/MazF family toxin [Dethiobacter sp.]